MEQHIATEGGNWLVKILLGVGAAVGTAGGWIVKRVFTKLDGKVEKDEFAIYMASHDKVHEERQKSDDTTQALILQMLGDIHERNHNGRQDDK